ncbi:FAD-dependent monooxygenase [Streptomyces sp. NPDC058439]|uniref:FAD-dependent monooxygenase n=1 Tax=Streptomyces sp. NPDC058439 TaxID=3346500 RepID=UPI0036531682
MHLPITGQGLNTGMQDALNLGWTLAAELNGWAPAGLFDTDHSERWPAGERLCWSTSAQDGLLFPLDQVAPLRELFAELVKMNVVNKFLMNTPNGPGITYEMNTPNRLGITYEMNTPNRLGKANLRACGPPRRESAHPPIGNGSVPYREGQPNYL